MAKKKKENTLSYLQMPLPEGGKYSKMTKVAFGGLNKRYTHDSGSLSMESNISTNEYPYLTPSETKVNFASVDNPVSMYAFDNCLIVVHGGKYNGSDCIFVQYVTEDTDVAYTGILNLKDYDIKTQRSVVQFNVYDTPTDPLTGQYVKKLLFFPDKASMYMKIVESEDGNPANWEAIHNGLAEANKHSSALSRADLGVMYHYDGYFYTVVMNKRTVEEEAEGGKTIEKVEYYRTVQCKNPVIEGEDGEERVRDFFLCDSLESVVKEYTNKTPEVDQSGAIIYPPPDTASHNCYYRNSFNNDVYRWCEYETIKREKDKNGEYVEFGVRENDDGELEIYGFEKDGENYISDGGTAYGWKVSIPPAVPSLKYATVHLSRVFGVDDDRVYASGYNDYANWNLDTVDEYNEANAWCSPSQSNSKAGGSFTGITTFQGHVVCFKRDFMHEIYNTKNPFRLTDIYAEGTIDNRTIQDVDGKLIFVSEDDVKIYTGSNPRIIGYNLNMSRYTYAVSGTDNRNYYLYCENGEKDRHLYVYDTYTELWSEQEINTRILSFTHNNVGMYMLDKYGNLYQLDTGEYNHEWSFETDLITNKTVSIKHIKRLQMLVDIPDKDSWMNVYILYDEEEFDSLEDKKTRLVYSFEKAKETDKPSKFPIRLKPRNTANYGFKLHFEGEGYVKLYELEIFVEAGGDLIV